jgi:hypothetical protein
VVPWVRWIAADADQEVSFVVKGEAPHLTLSLCLALSRHVEVDEDACEYHIAVQAGWSRLVSRLRRKGYRSRTVLVCSSSCL